MLGVKGCKRRGRRRREETQTKGKMGLNSQGLCLALNSCRLQFPGNKGMQDLRQHHSDPEEQMVPAAFSSSG